MDSTHWEKIQALFHDAADLPESEQRAFLNVACGSDDGLIAEVLSLLREDARDSSLLGRDVGEVAHQILREAPPLPKEIGHYHLQRVLGEGGMGVVYLAERDDLGSLVAIKVLRDAWLSPARRERFTSEQRMLAQLNHPSIARLYDADILADGTPWFVMEYVEGVPLTEYCSQHACSIDERLQLLRSVCEAVQYAHSHAVIHRDLKPSNIFVKSDGTVRLLDFGIAKQIESLEVAGSNQIDQTLTGLRLMTPAYAAPEQIRGERVGVHTDVYSLGVILYELLAGKRPFDLSNLTPAEAETVIVEHDPEKPSAAARQIAGGPSASDPSGMNSLSVSKAAWADLDVLGLTAMHKDPQRRYRSVEALMRDIDHYLNGEPLEARLDNFTYKLGKFVRRNKRAVASAALVLAVIVAMVTVFTLRLAKARDTALAEAARTARIQRFMLNLFQGGDEAAGPSDDLRVLTLLDRGVQEAQSLSGEPEVQAELRQTLSGIYQKLGKFDRADSLLLSALDQRKQLFGPDHRAVADSLVALALLRSDEAKYEEAERLARDGLEMTKRYLPSNHPAVANATFALGKVLEGRGNYEQAIQVLGEAVRLQSVPGVPTADLAASLSELANSHFYTGHYDISDALNRRVLAMQTQLYGERHPMVADTLLNLGSIQFQLGNYVEAERYNRKALDIVQSWYGRNHPETADTMTILGQSLTYQQRYDEAADLLQQSLAILEHLHEPVPNKVAYALNELGNVAVRQGKLDDAATYFRRALDVYRSIYGDKHSRIGIAESNLAGVYVARKEYVRAERLFRDALLIYAQTLPADHVTVGIARIRLGTTLLGEHRFTDAQQESLAGYEIVKKQTSPTVKWLQTARKDLMAESVALHEPEQEEKFRAELGGSGSQ
jgi:serine/threonine protein kinase/tetratricopeptide (TPR) repeat protein